MSIMRLSHVEIRVPDLELATAYYTEVLGLYETAREPERVFLKCWDEHQHHSVILKYAPTYGLEHFGFSRMKLPRQNSQQQQQPDTVGITSSSSGAPPARI